jgi:hypothetical protein
LSSTIPSYRQWPDPSISNFPMILTSYP